MEKEKIKIKILKIEGKEVQVEEKALKAQIKAIDDGQGIIEAYVSVFGNVDSYGDIVEKGAFANAVKAFLSDGRYPKGVWAHDWSLPIAKTLEMREDNFGLYIKAQLVLSVQKAQEAYDLIKAGVITDFSFGFSVDKSNVDADGVRHITNISIYEWSPVLVGANPETQLLSVKSADKEKLIEAEKKLSEIPQRKKRTWLKLWPWPTWWII